MGAVFHSWLCTDDDDEQQPMSLDQWLERQRQDFLSWRALAHAKLDIALDQVWAEQQKQMQIFDRSIDGMAQH